MTRDTGRAAGAAPGAAPGEVVDASAPCTVCEACPDACPRRWRDRGWGTPGAGLPIIPATAGAAPPCPRDASRGDTRHDTRADIGPWATLRRAAIFVVRQPELRRVAIAAVLLITSTVLLFSGGPVWLRFALCLSAGVLASTRTGPEALRTLRRLRVDIDLLMFAAAIGAAFLLHFEEGAFLLVLFGLGAAGEHLALGHARSAIRALSELAPETAAVEVADDVVQEQRVEHIAIGSIVILRPFDRVPLDGELIDGSGAIDESTLTGEPVPVVKEPGSPVFAGTLNGEVRLRMRVTKPAAESTIARIMRLVSETQANKSQAQLFTERVERWYVPLVFLMTGALLLAQPLLFEVPLGVAFYRAMAFLTAASPCALAIGVPATVLCAVARAAQIGALIKGGGHLEALGSLRAIAYDKTGTITIGHPVVAAVHPANGFSEADVLRLAAAVEREVHHPLARAVVGAAGERDLSIPAAADVRQVSGAGAEGRVEDRVVRVGRPGFIAAGGATEHDRRRADAEATAQADAVDARDAGRSRVSVGVDGRFAGTIMLEDAIRPGMREVIARIRTMGVVRQVMLTGDHEAAARRVAEAVGLDAWEAALSPEEKLERIGRLRSELGTVAMVGDGVNDAPALAAASVGIAMGAAGTDAALETADVAIMGTTLERLPATFALAARSQRIIRQNLAIALGVIAVVAPMAAVGVAPLGVAVLLHEGSTLVVVANALRLLRARA
ncbi:MAG: heavy metal translocating P-type ATPase [Phycisphaeraceae bacterium]|nr:heavy metal translocating P-type ATPase [Phycisphaeraceae bacterium]